MDCVSTLYHFDPKFLKSFDDTLLEIIKNAHPYTSKKTLFERVLQQYATTFHITLHGFHDKNFICIHSDNMKKIDRVWQQLKLEQKIVYDEENVYKLFKYSDFVHLLDVQKLLKILAHKHEEGLLIQLLAMDGFHGNFKNYIENLKLGYEGSTHVHMIRNIYTQFPSCSVKIIYVLLLKLFITFIKDDEIQQLVINTIHQYENTMKLWEKTFLKNNIEPITHFYTHHVDDLETIALLKIMQLKIQSKKMKKMK